jgi:hypothetical protein
MASGRLHFVAQQAASIVFRHMRDSDQFGPSLLRKRPHCQPFQLYFMVTCMQSVTFALQLSPLLLKHFLFIDQSPFEPL